MLKSTKNTLRHTDEWIKDRGRFERRGVGEGGLLTVKVEAVKAYRVCVAYFLRLLAKVELPLSAKDLVNTLAIENGDPRFVLLDFIDEDLRALKGTEEG